LLAIPTIILYHRPDLGLNNYSELLRGFSKVTVRLLLRACEPNQVRKLLLKSLVYCSDDTKRNRNVSSDLK